MFNRKSKASTPAAAAPTSPTTTTTTPDRQWSEGVGGSPKDNLAAFKRKYKVHKTEIGRGAFSTVRLGENRETQEQVAIKIIEKKSVVTDNAKKNLDREIQILTRVDHPNIVMLKDMYDTGDRFLFVMELVTGGELFDRIVEKGSYSEDDAKTLVRQILQGVGYLHSTGIAHRDLKPENLLLKSRESDMDIKIADFGLSSFVDSQKMMTACGTPAYVAPEVLSSGQGGYDKEVDMWSVGVITYILLCGFAPFHGDSVKELLRVVVRAQFSFPSPYWDPISPQAKDFISKLLVKEPSERLSASQAVQHPWLKSAGSRISLPSFRDQMQRYVISRKRESQEAMEKLLFNQTQG